MRWDIFCKVIDNHGDTGVCWRLACNLAARGQTVRLWIDDASALAWMAPGGQVGVEVGRWDSTGIFPPPGDVVVEAFGCELPQEVVGAMAARSTPPRWINLEYLTAEAFAERNHGLPSPVLGGPGAGLTKHFFYPGFTSGTGGLLREPDLLQRQSHFDRAAWLRSMGLEEPAERTISLFCYEPPALAQLLRQLQADPLRTLLLVAAGRPTAAVQACVHREPELATGTGLSISFLPLVTQREYDHLLWACDFNFVRGEDSLVRALWAGRPFAWQTYPQDDDAHHRKLDAFLDWMQAPQSLRGFHHAWNGVSAELPALDIGGWQEIALQARDRAMSAEDLASRLLRFVAPGAGAAP